MRKRYKRL